MTMLTPIAREQGVSAYVGEGLNLWPAVHRLDAAVVFRLALEKGTAGTRYHAVAEEGVPFKEIATALGDALHVPTVSKSLQETESHFGWFANFSMIDAPVSSEKTKESLGWRPTQIGLIADIRANYR